MGAPMRCEMMLRSTPDALKVTIGGRAAAGILRVHPKRLPADAAVLLQTNLAAGWAGGRPTSLRDSWATANSSYGERLDQLFADLMLSKMASTPHALFRASASQHP
jgi:hypothetical protein